ncbi:hypothetical protein [Polymorphobacter megasporae]|uniref:hypothetical protein n=1 Tax=Glacieibacterium megasporae TaxID=2835787 RepID=UPI001C1E0A97|nr:hypothetical protein [Polymorphobacter megasporae]UAJ09145.1 hypothetical protein KTC28_12410 [Polymorphobacter megasporae]
MATHSEVGRPVARLGAMWSIVIAFVVALLFLGVAAANRLPILFPDTIGYNRAGEAIIGVFDKTAARPSMSADHATAAGGPLAMDTNDGVSEARSPYFGLALAVFDRIGGPWLAAAAQALVAAVALILALERLQVQRPLATIGGVVMAVGGLAFYACVLLPDVFLGPVVLALAFLLTRQQMHRRERLFWALALIAGMLFHRSFLAMAIVIVIGSIVFYRQSWFDRRGWLTAVVLCLIAVIGHGSVAPVVEHVFDRPMASQPFLLARMAEGDVLPAYLNRTCPTTPYFFCKYRARLPMDHDKFLWDAGPGGLFNTMSLSDKLLLTREAGSIVAGAVKSDPVGAAIEAARLSVRCFFFAGMNDFSQRIMPNARIDPSLVSTMAAYPDSGIRTGSFPLVAVSQLTQLIYDAALLVLVVAGAVVVQPGWFGRHRIAALDRRLVAAIGVIIAGLLVNAIVCGTLSGVRDRYQGRIAWLASLAAVATLSHAAMVTRRRTTSTGFAL